MKKAEAVSVNQEADGRRCDICADDPEPCVHCWQRRAEDAVSVVEELREALEGLVSRIEGECAEVRAGGMYADQALGVIEAQAEQARALASSPPSPAPGGTE